MADKVYERFWEGKGEREGEGEGEFAASPDRLWKETSCQFCPLKVYLTQLHLAIIEVSLDAQGLPVLARCFVKLRLDPGLHVGALHGRLIQELARNAEVYIAPLQHACTCSLKVKPVATQIAGVSIGQCLCCVCVINDGIVLVYVVCVINDGIVLSREEGNMPVGSLVLSAPEWQCVISSLCGVCWEIVT